MSIARVFVLLALLVTTRLASAASFDQSRDLVTNDLAEKAQTEGTIDVIPNLYKLTGIGLASVALRVARQAELSKALVTWNHIAINSSLKDVTVSPTSAYATWLAMKSVGLYTNGDRIDVVDVTFNVNEQTYHCGVVIPALGIPFRYFDCKKL